jgi:hypothetical protein
MPGPKRGICAPPGAPCGGVSSRVRFSILRNGGEFDRSLS